MAGQLLRGHPAAAPEHILVWPEEQVAADTSTSHTTHPAVLLTVQQPVGDAPGRRILLLETAPYAVTLEPATAALAAELFAAIQWLSSMRTMALPPTPTLRSPAVLPGLFWEQHHLQVQVAQGTLILQNAAGSLARLRLPAVHCRPRNTASVVHHMQPLPLASLPFDGAFDVEVGGWGVFVGPAAAEAIVEMTACTVAIDKAKELDAFQMTTAGPASITATMPSIGLHLTPAGADALVAIVNDFTSAVSTSLDMAATAAPTVYQPGLPSAATRAIPSFRLAVGKVKLSMVGNDTGQHQQYQVDFMLDALACHFSGDSAGVGVQAVQLVQRQRQLQGNGSVQPPTLPLLVWGDSSGSAAMKLQYQQRPHAQAQLYTAPLRIVFCTMAAPALARTLGPLVALMSHWSTTANSAIPGASAPVMPWRAVGRTHELPALTLHCGRILVALAGAQTVAGTTSAVSAHDTLVATIGGIVLNGQQPELGVDVLSVEAVAVLTCAWSAWDELNLDAMPYSSATHTWVLHPTSLRGTLRRPSCAGDQDRPDADDLLELLESAEVEAATHTEQWHATFALANAMEFFLSDEQARLVSRLVFVVANDVVQIGEVLAAAVPHEAPSARDAPTSSYRPARRGHHRNLSTASAQSFASSAAMLLGMALSTELRITSVGVTLYSSLAGGQLQPLARLSVAELVVTTFVGPFGAEYTGAWRDVLLLAGNSASIAGEAECDFQRVPLLLGFSWPQTLFALRTPEASHDVEVSLTGDGPARVTLHLRGNLEAMVSVGVVAQLRRWVLGTTREEASPPLASASTATTSAAGWATATRLVSRLGGQWQLVHEHVVRLRWETSATEGVSALGLSLRGWRLAVDGDTTRLEETPRINLSLGELRATIELADVFAPLPMLEAPGLLVQLSLARTLPQLNPWPILKVAVVVETLKMCWSRSHAGAVGAILALSSAVKATAATETATNAPSDDLTLFSPPTANDFLEGHLQMVQLVSSTQGRRPAVGELWITEADGTGWCRRIKEMKFAPQVPLATFLFQAG